MPKIRIKRGSFRDSSGERAEPGDVIEVDDDTLERLNTPSYEVVEGGVDPTVDDEVPEVETAGPDPDTDPEASTTPDEPVEPEPVTAAESEEPESEPEPEPEPDIDSPDGADADDVGDTSPTPDVPDDYTLLSKMAATYEGDDVHGSMSGDEISSFLETLSPTEVNGLKRQAKMEMED